MSCAGASGDVSFTITYYDPAEPPVTFSGGAPGVHTRSELSFIAPEAGDYVARVTLADGAATVTDEGDYTPTTLAAPGGDARIAARDSGMFIIEATGAWSLTVDELPPNLSVNRPYDNPYLSPGGAFNVLATLRSESMLSAHVEDEGGHNVRQIESDVPVEMDPDPAYGSVQSIIWDGLGNAGARLRDGHYTIVVDATNTVGTSEERVPVVLDSVPPKATLTTPTALSPTLVGHASDASSGLLLVQFNVDGQWVILNQLIPNFSYSVGSMSSGHAILTAEDKAGNFAQVKTSWSLSAGQPPKHKRWCSRHRAQAALHTPMLARALARLTQRSRARALGGFRLRAFACAKPRHDGSRDIGLLLKARHALVTPVAVVTQASGRHSLVYLSTNARVDALHASGHDFVEHRRATSHHPAHTVRLRWNGRRFAVVHR